MWVTLKDVKIKWRWKSLSKMTNEELIYFNWYLKKQRDETIRLEELLIKQNINCDNSIIVSPMFLSKRNKNVPDKKFSLNLNQYRNWNFIISNDIKQYYKEVMKQFIWDLKFMDQIEIEYKIFYWKNEPDLMNIVSVQSKFFLDLLVTEWLIKDDSVKYVIKETSIVWGKDIWNERVEIKIKQTTI